MPDNNLAPYVRLRPEQAAAYVGVHVDTLNRWERDGRVPCERLPSGHRRYRVRDLDALLKNVGGLG